MRRRRGLTEDERQAALAAVLAVKVAGHEDARAALLRRALAPQAAHLAGAVDLVVAKRGHLLLLVLVGNLLGRCVVLLLALLAAAAQTQHQMER